MGVGIPGVPERGVAMCVAVGLAGGDASRGMDVLGSVTEAHHQQALDLLPLIEVKMDDTRTNLYVETILESDEDTVRVITDGNHDRIVAVEPMRHLSHTFPRISPMIVWSPTPSRISDGLPTRWNWTNWHF